MNSRLCAKLGIEFPVFAFSHCRNVVVEVSKAGGFGVLGAVGLTPENLEQDLNWIDEKIDGKPYGIDLLIPNRMDHKNENSQTSDDLKALIPKEYYNFVDNILEAHDLETNDLWAGKYGIDYTHNMREAGANQLLEVAFRHPITLFVNALGVPPKSVIKRCQDKNILAVSYTHLTLPTTPYV